VKTSFNRYWVSSAEVAQREGTYPLPDKPPPAEKPPVTRSTTFIVKSTMPVSVHIPAHMAFKLENISQQAKIIHRAQNIYTLLHLTYQRENASPHHQQAVEPSSHPP
jgi:hypothetical protein